MGDGQAFGRDERVRFFIGDVRDNDRLARAMDGIDFVVHAAATKIVPTAEYNPFECVKTNIIGAMNVIDTCIDAKVSRVVALSTDKASSPVNLYGATQARVRQVVRRRQFLFRRQQDAFCRGALRQCHGLARLGHSVLPVAGGTRRLPITDPRMTRFMITLEQAVELVWHAFEDMVGGEIYVKKIPSMNITDIAAAAAPDARGDRRHPPRREAARADDRHRGRAAHVRIRTYYKILPAIHRWSDDPARISNGSKVPADFIYRSDNNPDWMSVDTLSGGSR